MTIAWYQQTAAVLCERSRDLAMQHQQQLTKPSGALGRLETLAVQFAAWQGQAIPSLEHIAIGVFAADHGVAHQEVSAFPQAVTAQMVANFLGGGAAINVLSRQSGADLHIYSLGLATKLSAALINHPQHTVCQLAAGTADFSLQPAMTDTQLDSALTIGRQAVQKQVKSFGLWIAGEMGIANTTSASALLAALLKQPVAACVGRGTGINDDILRHKQQIIKQALTLHQASLRDPLALLRCLGGFEIVALVGSMITAAQQGIPILVDGFITTVAALYAVTMNDTVKNWLLFSHRSAEQAHQLSLDALSAQPLLDLDLRLGEASGAALAVPLLQSALCLHRDMATFAQVGITCNDSACNASV